MIELRKHLYESLLDDEEELVNDEITVLKDTLNDPEFLRIYKSEKASIVPSKLAKLQGAISGSNTVNYDTDGKELIYNGSLATVGEIEDLKPVDYFLPGIDTINVKGTLEIVANEVSDKTFCSNVKAGKVICRSLTDLKDINMEISYSESRGIPSYMNHYGLVLDSQKVVGGSVKPMAIKNVNVNFTRHDINNIVLIESPYLKDLSGLHCNADQLKIYSPTMFTNRDYINAFDSILDTSYTSVAGDGISRKGNIKTIIATLNNTKKYSPHDQLFKAKPNAKLSDVIDVRNMKDLKSVIFYDATYALTPKSVGFFRDKNSAKTYASNLYRHYYDYMIDQLSDGWWMCITGNKNK